MEARFVDVPLLREAVSADDFWYYRAYATRLLLPYTLFPDDRDEDERDSFRLVQSARSGRKVHNGSYSRHAPKSEATRAQFQSIRDAHKEILSEYRRPRGWLVTAEPFASVKRKLPVKQISAAYLIVEALISILQDREQNLSFTKSSALRLAATRAASSKIAATASNNSLNEAWSRYQGGAHLLFANLYVRGFRETRKPGQLTNSTFPSVKQFGDYLRVAKYVQDEVLLKLADTGRTRLAAGSIWRLPNIEGLPALKPEVPELTRDEAREAKAKATIS